MCADQLEKALKGKVVVDRDELDDALDLTMEVLWRTGHIVQFKYMKRFREKYLPKENNG